MREIFNIKKQKCYLREVRDHVSVILNMKWYYGLYHSPAKIQTSKQVAMKVIGIKAHLKGTVSRLGFAFVVHFILFSGLFYYLLLIFIYDQLIYVCIYCRFVLTDFSLVLF